MSQIFNTCTAISSSSDLDYLYMHLSNGYQYMAMTDYPYPANFLEPMPAWPVEVSTQPFAEIQPLTEWLKDHPTFKPAAPAAEPYNPWAERYKDVIKVEPL
jgi:hypothetical protein